MTHRFLLYAVKYNGAQNKTRYWLKNLYIKPRSSSVDPLTGNKLTRTESSFKITFDYFAQRTPLPHATKVKST